MIDFLNILQATNPTDWDDSIWLGLWTVMRKKKKKQNIHYALFYEGIRKQTYIWYVQCLAVIIYMNYCINGFSKGANDSR